MQNQAKSVKEVKRQVYKGITKKHRHELAAKHRAELLAEFAEVRHLLPKTGNQRFDTDLQYCPSLESAFRLANGVRNTPNTASNIYLMDSNQAVSDACDILEQAIAEKQARKLAEQQAANDSRSKKSHALRDSAKSKLNYGKGALKAFRKSIVKEAKKLKAEMAADFKGFKHDVRQSLRTKKDIAAEIAAETAARKSKAFEMVQDGIPMTNNEKFNTDLLYSTSIESAIAKTQRVIDAITREQYSWDCFNEYRLKKDDLLSLKKVVVYLREAEKAQNDIGSPAVKSSISQ